MLLPAPFRASIAPPARPASAAPPAISGVFAFEAAFATVSPTCDVLSRTVEARCEPELDFAELLLRLAFEERPLLERPFEVRLAPDRALLDLLAELLPFERLEELERRAFVWAILASFFSSGFFRSITLPGCLELNTSLLRDGKKGMKPAYRKCPRGAYPKCPGDALGPAPCRLARRWPR
jgi:hypothetical protein